jgi:hypothetical protein
MVGNSTLRTETMNYISKEHWDSLYTKLYDAYEECSKNYDETYRQKIGMILDHMIYNQPYLAIQENK